MGVGFVPSPLNSSLLHRPRQVPSFPLSPRTSDVAPTYAHPHRRQPPALSRPPRGLGRGRVCSIDRRRSAKLAERDRAPSWRRTARISSFACHPLFRKSSYPLLDLPTLIPFSCTAFTHRVHSTLRPAVLSFVPHVALARQQSFQSEKKGRGADVSLDRRARWAGNARGATIESSRRKSRPPIS